MSGALSQAVAVSSNSCEAPEFNCMSHETDADRKQMRTLEGEVAVITGSTSGIGARTAEVFVAEGAKVVIVGRRQDRGEALARKLGDAASFIRTDVSVEDDVKGMIDHALDRFGRLDCLMNNAGRSSQYAVIADADLEQFDAVVAVHLRAVLAGMKYAARVMAVQGKIGRAHV